MGVAVSAVLLLGSVLGASSFLEVARDRAIERVRQELQAGLDDETVSAAAAERFLETLPSGGGDFHIVDRDRMRALFRALGETDSNPEEAQEPSVQSELERRASALVRELRLVSAACTLLFGLACWLLCGPAVGADPRWQAARLAACGAGLIGSGYAVTWFRLGSTSHDFVIPVTVIATGLVLTLMLDALFNDFRATRVALDISRFWP